MNIDIWAEKYRPKTIDDCVLPKRYKTFFKNILESGDVPNLLLVGRPGVGKTTVAKALCHEMGVNYITINGSDESGIDTFRGKIKSFASTVSLVDEKLKVVILDEADYLNPNSTQPALRNFMEEFSSNCRFIATANYKQKIIEALQSRMTVLDFSFTKEEKDRLFLDFFKRVKKILKVEGCPVSQDEILVSVFNRYFPDFRKILVELQRYYITNKEINEGILASSSTDNKEFSELLKHIKARDYTSIRTWVARQVQSGTDPNYLIRLFFDFLEPKIDSFHIKSTLILILAKYQAELPFIVDYEIHITAMIMDVILNCMVGEQ